MRGRADPLRQTPGEVPDAGPEVDHGRAFRDLQRLDDAIGLLFLLALRPGEPVRVDVAHCRGDLPRLGGGPFRGFLLGSCPRLASCQEPRRDPDQAEKK